uniref:Putative reverse transcriptase n=1 Tax=Rhipicephalus microplus TaxID=6941 RepID=A0A6G5A9I2_RHIMP
MRNNDSTGEFNILPVTTGEGRKALEGMQRGKAAGEDRVTTNLLKDCGEIVRETVPTVYMNCVLMGRVPESWKNANIIVIHKKGDVKYLKNCRPISLLSVLYKLFTKIIANRIKATLEFNQPNHQAGFCTPQKTIFICGNVLTCTKHT